MAPRSRARDPQGGRLEEYATKRDFERTPEPPDAPEDDTRPPGDGAGRRFVIQQHDATRLHWDLRLEHDGVLLSWALPRGLPWDPERNHLAVHTEDHPLEYLTFEGNIPDGNYGAGMMTVWDTGTYAPEKIEDRKLVVVLRGERARGRYALFQTRGRDWMIHRMDPPEDPTRRHPPERFELMSAEPGPAPSGTGWALETHWRGERCVLTSSGGVVDLVAAGGDAIGGHFPEVRPIGRALGITEVVLDGVLTAPDGSDSYLRRRLEARSDSTRRRLARDQPVALVAFDLLWLDGHPQMDQPWRERRARLDELGLEGPAWTTPSAYEGDAAPIVEAAAASGVDTLLAKRVDAHYDPALEPSPWRIFRVPRGG
jgi:bifunctional non-homologous end joining protein LigD